jgi:hypothetical protein
MPKQRREDAEKCLAHARLLEHIGRVVPTPRAATDRAAPVPGDRVPPAPVSDRRAIES